MSRFIIVGSGPLIGGMECIREHDQRVHSIQVLHSDEFISYFHT